MESYDIIIRNGFILDGTGSPPIRADVAIRDDRIAAVGDLQECHAGREINAEGLHVAPGFVDIHTHSDISVTFHPQMESMLAQGVTTQVVGNCSLCIGLATDAEVFAFEKRWLGVHGKRIVWDTLAGHLRYVEDHGVGTNYVMLAGQGTLRKRVVGLDRRPPTPDEMDAMKRLLAQAMEDGAWGISTGLEYSPSGYADVDELVELSKVAAAAGGIYATHLRNEGDRLVEAVQEALTIGERANIPVQLSHHKAEGPKNWGKVRTTLAMVEEARSRGMDVQLDQYPYTAFQTSMAVQFLPSWANVGDNDAILARLEDPEQRERIAGEMLAAHPDWADLGPDTPWERVRVSSCRIHREYQGRTIAELARERGTSPIQTVIQIILEERNFVSAVNFALCEEDVEFVMKHPLVMIGSDAVGTSPYGRTGEDRVHPRCYGTFPRVLGRYVRQRHTLDEAEAIRKMTSLPADRLGIPNRGRLMPGAYADIVVYNPLTVEDRADFEHPHRFARGIELVLVNGRVAWEGGHATPTLAGRVLRHTG